MAPGLKFLSKKKGNEERTASSSKRLSSYKGKNESDNPPSNPMNVEQSSIEPAAVELQKLTIPEYINVSFGGNTLVCLVGLADARDEVVKIATAGFFPDVITGCVDVTMAVVESLLKFADSIDSEARESEEVMRHRVRTFMLSVLDAVYGPNCVRITVYNPDIDWNVSIWQMFPVPESPSSRTFLVQVPSQSDTVIQWMDLKSRLMKQCRNPKREAQRIHKIAALEDELQELALRHAALIERFIKIQQGEKDPEAAQAKREAEAKRLAERKVKLKQILTNKHRVIDPAVRGRRDAFLWGGQPHIIATMAALNNSTMSKAASVGDRVRRMSRFGFRSEPDQDDLDMTSETSSAPEESDMDHAQPPSPEVSKRGCLGFLACCGPRLVEKKKKQKRRPLLS